MFCNDFCRFHRSIEWTGKDGGDVIISQPQRKSFNLQMSHIGQKNIRRAGEPVFSGKWRCAMTDEVEAGSHNVSLKFSLISTV